MTGPASALAQLEVMYEAPGLPRSELPEELERLYGGGLDFARPSVVANFVSTLDGVVALPSIAQSNKLISTGSEPDRFVMGLLRAFADAVVIGSGTLHGSPRGRWRPESPDPLVNAQLEELRRGLGRPTAPEVAILTRTGGIDLEHPVLREGALIVTTESGKAALRGHISPANTVVSLGDSVDPPRVIELLRDRGHSLVLSEAGPTLFGAFLAADVVDELFLTVSPLLAGRDGDDRLQLVEAFSWLPGEGPVARLLSARRDGSHLFLRYALR